MRDTFTSVVYGCFATAVLLLALLPLQQSMSLELQGYVVRYGLERGVEELRPHGFVDTAYSGYATVWTTSAAVERLRDMGFTVYRPRVLRPLLDLSTVDIGVNLLNNVTGVNAESVDGRGVLIAVVDTGVDLSHPAFKTSEGRNRILYVWDQTINGKPPKGFSYGYECGPDEIQQETCPERDFVGHGTIVASIAAGGVGGGWRLRGVAPGAELIVVKSGGPACGGSRWFFDEKGLIDGISYAVEKARSLGRRLVVVLSLGTNLGGHDGGEPLERMLEAWAEEGVVFAVAAGNSGDEARHATGFLAPGAGGSEWGVAGTVGELESYSGRGPTVDNRTKPEITAPGGVIFAAGPSNLPRQAFSPSELVRVSRGTSMAAPHAAGAAALILQLAPELTARQVIELMKNNARQDRFTGPIGFNGSNKWGWGKLNADIAYVAELFFTGRYAEARPSVNFGGKTYDASGGAIKLAALKGFDYNITPMIYGGSDYTRYTVEPKSLVVTAAVKKAFFSIEAIHRLQLINENGSLFDELWVKEGSTVNLNTLLTGRGLTGYDVQYVLDDGTRVGDVLYVSKPTTVKLLLKPKQTYQPSGAVLVAVSVAAFLSAALVFAALRFRRGTTSQGIRRQALR